MEARVGRAAAAVMMLVFLAACGGPGPTSPSRVAPGTVTVGSFDFPESEVLAEVYGQALEAKGLPVRLALNLGPRELVLPALLRRLVHLVPEYEGSALDFLSRSLAADADPVATHTALDRVLSPTGAVALRSAPAQDANAFAVTRATARQFHLRTVSDLGPFAGRMVFGGPRECPQRPLCLPGLRSVYGLSFRRFYPLDTGGSLTIAALTSGNVDVALVFSSDPVVADRGFVLLRDDRRLEPAENVTPVVGRAMVRRYGARLTSAIDAVSARLTGRQLVSINRAVAAGRSPATVAAQWLAGQGLIP
ncbi:MAG: ABC transporter substrate-binding protein [Actinomycetota bacterium]